MAHGPPLVLASLVFVGLAVYLTGRHDVRERLPEANVAVLILLAAGIWIGAYGFETLRTDYGTKVLLNRVAYLGSATLPVLWYEYVRLHAGGDRESPRWRTVALWTVPAVTLALVFTNGGMHSLVWEAVYLDDTGGFVSLINDHGPAFYGFILFAYALIFAGMARLVGVVRTTTGARQTQELSLLLGAALPTVGGAVYVAPWNPFPSLNLPAIAFAAAAGTVAWSVVRHGLFTLVPIGWQAVVDQLDEAAIVLDTNGCVLEFNPAAEAYLSDPADAHGRDGRDVLHPTIATAAWTRGDGGLRAKAGELRTEDESRTADGLRTTSGLGTANGPGTADDSGAATPASSVRDGDPVLTRTLERPDGDVRHLEIERSPLESGGRRVGSLVLVRDVTSRHRREMRLQAQNERLDQFASVVSHDLRNPLNVARGYTELARETREGGHFDRVEEAHERIERIVTDLLVLAREGDALGTVESVSLSTAARTAWQSVDTTAGETGDGVTASLVVADETTLEADAGQLRHLFENLFRNCVEHGSADGRTTDLTVEVGALPEGGFYVEDDGRGIPPETHERVFERGFSTGEDGTGLGLAIVEQIAAAHGWEVRVGAATNGGARFEFSPAD
ncbi:histidine kinase N-terminal 7TM domain-containing protein [Halogeometricum limi]|uniref:histidine kinase N-terminal 7TM domain-containing protein n=1 Tax=Halogeometricum limi TaxID=555875 RepID=UPI001FE08D9D|nr:histidine kinase N-terminal 7TM domain-containing protein [Halogeometricum limi]